MDQVLREIEERVPGWNAAIDGDADWEAISTAIGRRSTGRPPPFPRELIAAYPDAKVLLSSRSAESWWDSISQTILAVLTAPEKWPDEQREWLEMVSRVVIDRSLGGRTDREGAMAAFEGHEAAVKAAVPDGNVLVFRAKDGWEPLCDFLGVPVPDGPFPRSNSRQEFFELLASGGEAG